MRCALASTAVLHEHKPSYSIPFFNFLVHFKIDETGKMPNFQLKKEANNNLQYAHKARKHLSYTLRQTDKQTDIPTDRDIVSHTHAHPHLYLNTHTLPEGLPDTLAFLVSQLHLAACQHKLFPELKHTAFSTQISHAATEALEDRTPGSAHCGAKSQARGKVDTSCQGT